MLITHYATCAHMNDDEKLAKTLHSNYAYLPTQPGKPCPFKFDNILSMDYSAAV